MCESRDGKRTEVEEGRKYLEHKETVGRKSDSRGCGRTRQRQQRRRRLQNQGGPHRKSEGGTKNP